jgi:tetratricopeptide (TPR) repeat protein
MAHACLATNRNNSALLLFFSANDHGARQSWSAWTESLLERSKSNPVAAYLSADADARGGSLGAAAEKLSLATKQDSKFALGFNARGVVRAVQGRWDEALLDFVTATDLAPQLADAHVSLGTYWVLQEAPDAAIQAAESALAINWAFALAFNVRGCAHFGKGEFQKASNDFTKARELCPLLGIADVNHTTMLASMQGRTTFR